MRILWPISCYNAILLGYVWKLDVPWIGWIAFNIIVLMISIWIYWYNDEQLHFILLSKWCLYTYVIHTYIGRRNNVTSQNDCSTRERYTTTPKQKCRHFDEIFITDCTESCQNDISVSVYICIYIYIYIYEYKYKWVPVTLTYYIKTTWHVLILH